MTESIRSFDFETVRSFGCKHTIKQNYRRVVIERKVYDLRLKRLKMIVLKIQISKDQEKDRIVSVKDGILFAKFDHYDHILH